MRKLLAALAATLSLALPAYGQVPNFPQTLPGNSVVGRLGISAGPSEAIPINTLIGNLGTCAANTLGCLSFGAAPSSEPAVGFWPIGVFRFGQDLGLVGNSGIGSANEFGMLVDVNVPQTNSLASFQKNAIEALCVTNEPNPGFTTQKACVGVEGRSYIASTNPTGQAYGGLDWAYIIPGGTGDGALIGREIDMYNNNGTDQSDPTVNPGLRKVGIQIVSLGTVNGTAAMHIIGTASGGAADWHKGVYAQSGDFPPLSGGGSDPNASFLELAGLWKVRSDGSMVITYPAAPASPIAFFESNNHNEAPILLASFPSGAGTTADAPSIQFWFKDSTSVQYQGAGIFAQPASVTHGSMTVTLDFATMLSGTIATTAVLQSNAFFPATNNVVSLGQSSLAWSNIFTLLANLKPQTVLPTCNAAATGTLIYLSNATAVTNNTTAATGGANGAVAICAGATPTWTILGGHA